MLSLIRLSRSALRTAQRTSSKAGVESSLPPIWAPSCPQTIRTYATSLNAERYNPNSRIDYEVSQSPAEWKYVERLLPSKLIPEVIPKDEYLSGWRPPSVDDLHRRPYFVGRSRNHMIPVYLKISHRGMRRVTIVRRVQGDIWRFEADLRAHLLKSNLDVGVRVDEVGGKVLVRGDFVNDVSKWLESQGF